MKVSPVGNPPEPRGFDHRYGQPVTERQLQVLRGVADGKTYAEVGADLFLSEATIRTHVRYVLAKLGARNAAHAVHLAHQRGLLGEEARDG